MANSKSLLLGTLFLMSPSVANAQTTEPREQSAAEAIGKAQATESASSGLVECAQMAARLDSSKKLLGELDKMSGFLDRLGKFLTVASVVNHTVEASKTGDTGGLANDAAGLIVSKGGCAAFGIYCPAYSVGLGIGTIVDYAPKVLWGSDRTLNDMWTDVWFDVLKGDGMATEGQIRAKVAVLRSRMQEARNDTIATEARNAQCLKSAKTKTAIDDVLARAKARARSNTSADSDPSLVAETLAAARNASAARAETMRSITENAAQSLQTLSTAATQTGGGPASDPAESETQTAAEPAPAVAPANRVCLAWAKLDMENGGYYCTRWGG